METTIYLIRHSERFKSSLIETYRTNQSNLIKSEKSSLSVEGERRADILSKEEELKNIDAVYASNCVRTLQTAKYLLDKQNLKINIDDRLDERRVGIPNDDVFPDWFERQYLDKDYKTINGESQEEVRTRMTEAIDEIVKKNRGKRIAIFSHGYAITFFLLKWCKLESVDSTERIKLSYKGKVIIDKILDAPEVFKIVLDDKNNILDIQNLEFDLKK